MRQPLGVSGDMTAEEVARLLDLAPHPNGGRYRESYRDAPGPNGAAGTSAIYYLLALDEVSAWHRLAQPMVWLWHAGAPLALAMSPDGRQASALHLGGNQQTGQRAQAIVPAWTWQAAESLGGWTLCSCIGVPGSDFSGLEMAPQDWRPG